MVDDFSIVQRLDFIRRICAGRRVLHLGCTNYPYTREAIENRSLLHFELDKIAASLVGIDSDQQGIDELRNHVTGPIINADLERLDEAAIDEKFEVIVAGEVIEHLNNPGQFLSGIRRLMNAESTLVLTTINAYCAMRFLQFGFRGQRGKSEPVHPDHVAYYSPATLRLMLERHGLHANRILFYDVGSEHRPYLPWYWRAANDICVRLAPQWSDGVIAVCSLGPESD